MFKIFDYTFFRIYSFYVRKKDSIAFIQSVNFLSITQLVIIFTVLSAVERASSDTISVQNLSRDNFFMIWIGLFIGLWIINFSTYKNNRFRQALLDKYYESSFNSKIPTWLVFMSPVFLAITTIAILNMIK